MIFEEALKKYREFTGAIQVVFILLCYGMPIA